MTGEKTLEPEHQLALVTKIRQEMSNKDSSADIKKILENTSILPLVAQILALSENLNPLIRYLKLESTWIIVNIGYGDEQDILSLFDMDYNISTRLNEILASNDVQMIDQCIWFISNACGESPKIRNMILSQTFVINSMIRIISEAHSSNQKIMNSFFSNMIWCCSNLSKKHPCNSNDQYVSLTTEEHLKIFQIIESFMSISNVNIPKKDALWTIHNLLEDCNESFITQVCHSKEIITKLVHYMNSHLGQE